jgi:hypothetical protein
LLTAIEKNYTEAELEQRIVELRALLVLPHSHEKIVELTLLHFDS